MRARTLKLSGITLIIFCSCADKKDFNITSAEIDVDTLEVRQKYDSFESQISKNLLEKLDTTDLWTSLGSLTDTSTIKAWDQQSTNLGIEYFDDIIKELSKPNIVKDLEKDAIHFTLTAEDHVELEVSRNWLVFSKNKEKVKSKPLSEELWLQAMRQCTCDSTDNLNHIIMNFQSTNIYRLDVTMDKKYQFCWKIFNSDDILSQLLKEIEQ